MIGGAARARGRQPPRTGVGPAPSWPAQAPARWAAPPRGALPLRKVRQWPPHGPALDADHGQRRLRGRDVARVVLEEAVEWLQRTVLLERSCVVAAGDEVVEARELRGHDRRRRR